MRDHIIDLAKKIKALSDNGIDGEKENAKAMLARFKLKHFITDDEIEEEAVSDYFFNVREDQQKLFGQIAASIMGEIPIYKERTKKKRMVIKCSAYNAILLDAQFDFYSRLFSRELEALYYAFFSQHNIWSRDKAPGNFEQLTPEQEEKLWKAERMRRGLSDESFQRQLPGIKTVQK